MSAAHDLIREADAQGIRLFVDDGKLKWRAKSPPADDLLRRLREHKPEVIREVQGASSGTADAIPHKPSKSTLAVLVEAHHFNVSCKLDGDNLLLSLPPGTRAPIPARIVDAIRGNKPEIIAILCDPKRPKGYSDDEWLAAIVDAARLGYPRERSL